MMNFETVVRHYWPEALCTIRDDPKERELDQEAIKAVTDRKLPNRRDGLRKWLWFYRVLQGFTAPERLRIADAVLGWADDDRNQSRDLTTSEALAAAHAELMKAVCRDYGKRRDFTSLASKALWLCYPEDVPMFDAWTRNALYVISKVENGINPIAEKTPEYEQFVHVWKQLYSNHKETIEDLDIGTYPYRVRVFDRILWLIGRPSYQTDWTSRRSTQS